MINRVYIPMLFLFLSVFAAQGQTNYPLEYKVEREHPFSEEQHRFGPYYMDGMSVSQKGNPMYPGIMTEQTGRGVRGTIIPWNDFTLTVPRAEAEAFKNDWNNMQDAALSDAVLVILNDTVAVQKITFTTSEGKIFTYNR